MENPLIVIHKVATSSKSFNAISSSSISTVTSCHASLMSESSIISFPKILAAELVFDDVQRKGASYFKFQGVEKRHTSCR